MPSNELEIGVSYEVLQRYTCKNRVTKAKIKMVRIKYLVNGKDVGRGTYLTCLDHNETRHCQNKTEALYQMRQPWVWCDGCAQIHFNTEWQNQLHHGELANTRPIEDALLARAEQAEAIIRGMFPLWIAAMSYAEHGRAADLDRIRNYYNGRDNPLTGEQLHYLFSMEDKK